ncbi:hypothetical protein EW145_g3389 [Phellinidium pouzarii]|uniref:BTB domain-containing protein n=1 Tax=Phellinidium pouzarii TaxID=167371 RepID=A0A4S4L8R8_9AGAM|nr:hypothetical protein EW145_g3389 [Phellinidium pouzarii]
MDMMDYTVMEEKGEPWFEDGNLILEADNNAYFKIHRGVLARQSEVFKDMLALPQPSNTSTVGELETVRMFDLPAELSNLLKAIYDGVIFQDRDIEDFFFLASILRLSTKYFVAHLRRQAIEALAQTWSYTLEGHDTMIERAVQAPMGSPPNDLTYPYVHPIHVLNLCRETHVRVIVPSALYFLSMYPFPDLLQCTHPKLAVESHTGLPRPSSTLSIEDMSNYSLMYQHRIELILDYVRRFCSERRSHEECSWRRDDSDTPTLRRRPLDSQEVDPCSHTFARLASKASRSWFTRTGPLKWMLQTEQYLEGYDMKLCYRCKEGFRSDLKFHRLSIWKALPGIVGMPSWETLLESDLPRPGTANTY